MANRGPHSSNGHATGDSSLPTECGVAERASRTVDDYGLAALALPVEPPHVVGQVCGVTVAVKDGKLRLSMLEHGVVVARELNRLDQVRLVELIARGRYATMSQTVFKEVNERVSRQDLPGVMKGLAEGEVLQTCELDELVRSGGPQPASDHPDAKRGNP